MAFKTTCHSFFMRCRKLIEFCWFSGSFYFQHKISFQVFNAFGKRIFIKLQSGFFYMEEIFETVFNIIARMIIGFDNFKLLVKQKCYSCIHRQY